MKYLVTGAAGFIGFHVSRALLTRGDTVIGLDNLNDYYDPRLKEDRVKQLTVFSEFTFVRGDIADYSLLCELNEMHKFDKVCHLAAQAGVRYSLVNPFVYERANLLGFLNILEMCRNSGVENLVYASSSSVYGGNEKIPFSIEDRTDKPISLYAATKKANELMAYTYHHLYAMRCTGLRFFTVYGPWGRPDMALFKFTRAILNGGEIEVYNYGRMKRDFTYIDDIVRGVLAALDKDYDFEIFNLGNSQPVELGYFIECIERTLGRTARKKLLPLQPGDVEATYADIDYSTEKLGFVPKTTIEEGIRKFIEWYREYYGVL
ncbi:MAG: NAD-dependent epimerase [Syntrophomonadaceae bacterium]|nr:NAD-dependent epimerase [Syntrophomonadaceae bacterium]